MRGSAKVTVEWIVQEGSTSGWREYSRDFKRAFEKGARKAFGVKAIDVKVYATGRETMAAEVTLERDDSLADTSLNMEHLAEKMVQEAHGWILNNYDWIEEDIGLFTIYFEEVNRADTSMITDIDVELNPEMFGQQRLFSSVRSSLVKLGTAKKSLRPHIRPILSYLEMSQTKTASAWRDWEKAVNTIGAEEALMSLIGYVGSHEARESFKHIARMWDIPIEIGPRDRGIKLMKDFQRHFRSTEKLADEFAQSLDKRHLEGAVDDMMMVYGLMDL